MPLARSILHVDMDAFYASVEQRDHPELRGKPVVVGGTSNRGVVAAASYEARTFGIRSAMPIAEALRRCPDLLRVKPRMSHYKSVSRQIFAIFREFTPTVEGLSLDEAFLDVTASTTLFGQPEKIAGDIKQRILDETRLTSSVGVATNKLVAKIGARQTGWIDHCPARALRDSTRSATCVCHPGNRSGNSKATVGGRHQDRS